MSKKCCKSYKEGKACKKCPRFRDWNYLMSWKPIQLEPQNDGRGEWLKGSLSSCETQLRESRPLDARPAANTPICLTAAPFRMKRALGADTPKARAVTNPVS